MFTGLGGSQLYAREYRNEKILAWMDQYKIKFSLKILYIYTYIYIAKIMITIIY